MKKIDIVIIGGGITGSNILRELSKYQVSVVLLEANLDIGSGVTKGNGGIVHSGYDAQYGTLKAKLNVEGALMYPQLAKELEFAYEPKPTLTVGFHEDDREIIQGLLDNGQKNGVPGLKIVENEELFELEPHLNKDAICALYAPTAGITDPYEVAVACVENAIANGVDAYVDAKVSAIEKCEDGYLVKSKQGDFKCEIIINASGVYGDEIAKFAGDDNYKIIQRHGTLLIIEKACGVSLSASLFPVPKKDSKGLATLPACAGNIILGSTTLITENKEYKISTKEEVNELFASAQHMIPALKKEFIIRYFNGLRPVEVSSNNDFVIEESQVVENMYHAIGIQSPGIAAAPAVAKYIVSLIKEKHTLIEKSNFNPYRKRIIDFSELSATDQANLIAKNPSYGHIICRCEVVSEGEILDAIHRPCGARTIDGIKRRTRAGMGRCQGGFCQPRIVEILNRELGIPFNEIVLEEKDSHVFYKMEED